MDDMELDIVVYEGVYPPAEDSYLLMDVIEIDDSDCVLEAGCGCGLITTAIARIAKCVVATDISRMALENTKRNLRKNTRRDNWNLVQANLLTPLKEIRNFSVILFNPPYLPVEDVRTELDHAFVGGKTGIEITIRFLKQARKRIQKDGVIYTIASSIADVDGLLKSIDNIGLKGEIVYRKRMFFEELLVLKAKPR